MATSSARGPTVTVRFRGPATWSTSVCRPRHTARVMALPRAGSTCPGRCRPRRLSHHRVNVRWVTQDDLAVRAGIRRRTLVALEGGNPRGEIGIVVRVIAALDREHGEITSRSPEPRPSLRCIERQVGGRDRRGESRPHTSSNPRSQGSHTTTSTSTCVCRPRNVSACSRPRPSLHGSRPSGCSSSTGSCKRWCSTG